MRQIRMRAPGSILVLATTLAMVSSQPALAAPSTVTRSIVSVTGITLEGPGPSEWDASATASTGCAQTGFTPVTDGSYRNKSDAFDNALVLAIDGTSFDDADGEVPGAPLASETIVTADNSTFPALQVQRWDRVLPTSDTLRTLVRFRNTDTSPQSLTIEWDSDLGSDSGTAVRGSSSGNALYEQGDRWAVSSDDPTAPGDPVLTWALFGKHAAVQTSTVVTGLGNAQTCFTIDFSLSVPAGGVRYLMFFTELHGTNAKALSTATRFNSVAAGSPLLTGIKASVRAKISNWDL
jgi:hypothetical protein